MPDSHDSDMISVEESLRLAEVGRRVRGLSLHELATLREKADEVHRLRAQYAALLPVAQEMLTILQLCEAAILDQPGYGNISKLIETARKRAEQALGGKP